MENLRNARSMMQKSLLPLLCGSILFVTGCGTTAKFIYPDDGRKLIRLSETPKYQKKIAVTPFDDMRGNNNQIGTAYLFLVPLMPFGWGVYERPDAATLFLSPTIDRFDFTPSEDLAKASAFSLRRSGLFQDAFFTYGGEKDKADYLLEGEIVSTELFGTIWSYGLSIYHWIPKIFGAPHGTSENHLILRLKLQDFHKQKLLWDKDYNLSNKILQGLYYRWGHDVKAYPALMQEIMNDAVREIDQSLQK